MAFEIRNMAFEYGVRNSFCAKTYIDVFAHRIWNCVLDAVIVDRSQNMCVMRVLLLYVCRSVYGMSYNAISNFFFSHSKA